MSNLDRIQNFIEDTSADCDFEKVIIGQFDKYTVFIVSDAVPYFYVEYIAESVFEDVLIRFNLLKPEFEGMGEFEEWEELDKFLDLYWEKIIDTWNKLNKAAINPNKIKYN